MNFLPNNIYWKLLGPEDQISDFTHPDEINFAKDFKSDLRAKSFLMGRAAARQALKEAGDNSNSPILRNKDKSPMWPDGYIGSISHSGEHAIALVAKASDYRSIGVDIEYTGGHWKCPEVPRREDEYTSWKIGNKGDQALSKNEHFTWQEVYIREINAKIDKRIATENEKKWIAGDSLKLLQIFSAKEAIYKALAPISSETPGFKDVELTYKDGIFSVKSLGGRASANKEIIEKLKIYSKLTDKPADKFILSIVFF